MAEVVPQEPQSADDYEDRTTAAVKMVLVEIGQILGSFRGKFAVVGGSVPWLLLKGISPTGSGLLSKVEFIRRSDTQGGAAPATGCDVQHAGELARVPYTATYSFYSSK